MDNKPNYPAGLPEYCYVVSPYSGCPTCCDCTVDISCQDCWRKWLNEETNLEVKP